MAENNIEKTVPGSILQSQHFLIEFVAEFQKGLTGCSLEYNMSWMEMMGIILEILELFPTSVKAIEEILDGALCDWILFCGAADNIIASSKINEEIYFPPPLGSKKSLSPLSRPISTCCPSEKRPCQFRKTTMQLTANKTITSPSKSKFCLR